MRIPWPSASPRERTASGKPCPSSRRPSASSCGTTSRPRPNRRLPVAELVLELEDPGIDTSGGQYHPTAVARFVFHPPEDSGEREVRRRRFRFTAPLGPIETGEIAWYLERYCIWPSGVFQERARQVEKKLDAWGRLLAEPLLSETAREAFEAWQRTPADVTRRFSVLVDDEPVEGTGEEQAKQTREGATLLLSLPWELVHDGRSYLFQGARGVQVRRRLPNRESVAPLVTAAPIRVLLVSPRPEDDRAAYIDHRVSARPLVDALEPLGEGAADFTVLTPPTAGALGEELRRAREHGKPYHVVHFDGHGVYDRRHGLGGLCFERPEDTNKLEKRRSVVIMADELAGVVR